MTLLTLEGVPVYQDADRHVHFIANGAIDADGANGQSKHPHSGRPLFAYAPDPFNAGGQGLDHLANAGYPKHPEFYRDILVCDKRGAPIKFASPYAGDSPSVGYGFHSATAYVRRARGPHDPDRYLDSVSVPYVVVSPLIRRRALGIVLGCKARLTHTQTGRAVDCVVGDIGPSKKIGELSIAAADALGLDPNPRTGGEDANVLLYELWPGTPAVLRLNGKAEVFELQKA